MKKEKIQKQLYLARLKLSLLLSTKQDFDRLAEKEHLSINKKHELRKNLDSMIWKTRKKIIFLMMKNITKILFG